MDKSGALEVNWHRSAHRESVRPPTRMEQSCHFLYKLGSCPGSGKFSPVAARYAPGPHDACLASLFSPSGSRRRWEPCRAFSSAVARCRPWSAACSRPGRNTRSWSKRRRWLPLSCGAPCRPPTLGNRKEASAPRSRGALPSEPNPCSKPQSWCVSVSTPASPPLQRPFDFRDRLVQAPGHRRGRGRLLQTTPIFFFYLGGVQK